MRFSIVGTIIAYGINFFTAKLTSPPSLGPRSMAAFSAEALGGLAVAIGAGAVLASLVGAVLLLGRYRFLRVFTLTYAFIVMLVPVTRLREIFPATRHSAHKSAEAPSPAALQDLEALKNELASQAHEVLSDPATKRIEIEAPPPISSLQSDEERYVALLRAIAKDAADSRNEYQEALGHIGWGRLLNADRLLADPTLSESYKMLGLGRSIMTRFKTRSFQLMTRASERVKTSGLPAKTQREFMELLAQSSVRSLATLEVHWDIEEQIFDLFEEALDFLHAMKGTWTVNQSIIQFAEDADAYEYNAIIRHIDFCFQRQKENSKGLFRKQQTQAQ